MKLLLTAALLMTPWTPQERRRDPLGDPSGPESTRLPGGKNQSEEILKAEHQKSLEDASQLVKLAQQLQEELQKNDRFVLSIATLKKTEEIEKLARRIRGRVRR